MKQKRLMILGASNSQLPIILKAVELGYHVITVDNVPENIGHRFSHQNVNCSTLDYKSVCQIAYEHKINGIVTFASDVATKAVAYVAEQLSLPGCQIDIAETLSNKANFRQFQKNQNIVYPRFFIRRTYHGILEACSSLKAPILFKPVDTSGSRGMIKLDAVTEMACYEAFKTAQFYSRSNTVSIEEFIEGTDVSGDGFLFDGQLFAMVSQKFQQGFVTIGHRFPTLLSEQDQQRILSEVALVCQKAGYRYGPVDFDVKISDQQVVVIEMSPRLGGNGIPELIRYHTGIDLIKMTLRYTLGENIEFPDQVKPVQDCGSWVFGSETAGLIEDYAPLEELQAKVPELLLCRFNRQPGDRVEAFEHGGNSLGYALFNDDKYQDYISMVKKLKVAMRLSICEA